MSFQERGEAVVAAHDLAELKLIYRVLHSQLRDVPELMETNFVLELQTFLQNKAGEDGVDVGIHGDWEKWLVQHATA